MNLSVFIIVLFCVAVVTSYTLLWTVYYYISWAELYNYVFRNTGNVITHNRVALDVMLTSVKDIQNTSS